MHSTKVLLILSIACIGLSVVRAQTTTQNPNCLLYTAGSYGAPKPDVTTSANGDTISIAITMYHASLDNQDMPVFFALDSTNSAIQTCSSNADNIVSQGGQAWAVTANDCATTYLLTQTLTQILTPGNNNNWVASLDTTGTKITYSLPVYATYSVNNDNGSGNCVYVNFAFMITFETLLNVAAATSPFIDADNSFQFRLSGIFVANSNIVVQGSVIPLIPGSDLKNIAFTFVQPTPNIAFSDITSTSCLQSYGSSCSQTYAQSITSLGGPHTDISGAYVVSVDVWENNQLTRSGKTITFNVQYYIPQDPAVVDSTTINTQALMYTNNQFTTVRTASYSAAADSLNVRDMITSNSPVIPANFRLSMNAGFLCCVPYGDTISVYNPSTSTGGCSSSQGMTEWVNLGSEASHPNGVTETSSTTATPSQYDISINLASVMSTTTHSTPLTCQVLLISKLRTATKRLTSMNSIISNLQLDYVSVSSYVVQQSDATILKSNASIYYVNFTVALFALLVCILMN